MCDHHNDDDGKRDDVEHHHQSHDDEDDVIVVNRGDSSTQLRADEHDDDDDRPNNNNNGDNEIGGTTPQPDAQEPSDDDVPLPATRPNSPKELAERVKVILGIVQAARMPPVPRSVTDQPTAIAFLKSCLSKSVVAMNAYWKPNTTTRDRVPFMLSLAYDHTASGCVLMNGQLIESVPEIQGLLRDLFASESVQKVVWDPRILADFMQHHCMAEAVNVVDVCTGLMVTGQYIDFDALRQERGVCRLPSLTTYIQRSRDIREFMLSIVRSLLVLREALVSVSATAEEALLQASKVMCDVLSAKPMRTYAPDETACLLPLGILDPSELVGTPLTRCSHCARQFNTSCFPIKGVQTCRVCLEVALPCPNLRAAQACLDIECPYSHEENTVLEELLAQNMSTGTSWPTGTAVSHESYMMQNMLAAGTSCRLYPQRGHAAPCKDFFNGKCRDGDRCAFSHVPVPVYIPIRIPVPTTPDQLRFFQPCVHMKEFGQCTRVGCRFIHLPAELSEDEGYKWNDLPLGIKKQ
eukprot:PhM_4_TR16254/c0_g1_i1/m.48826